MKKLFSETNMNNSLIMRDRATQMTLTESDCTSRMLGWLNSQVDLFAKTGLDKKQFVAWTLQQSCRVITNDMVQPLEVEISVASLMKLMQCYATTNEKIGSKLPSAWLTQSCINSTMTSFLISTTASKCRKNNTFFLKALSASQYSSLNDHFCGETTEIGTSLTCSLGSCRLNKELRSEFKTVVTQDGVNLDVEHNRRYLTVLNITGKHWVCLELTMVTPKGGEKLVVAKVYDSGKRDAKAYLSEKTFGNCIRNLSAHLISVEMQSILGDSMGWNSKSNKMDGLTMTATVKCQVKEGNTFRVQDDDFSCGHLSLFHLMALADESAYKLPSGHLLKQMKDVPVKTITRGLAEDLVFGRQRSSLTDWDLQQEGL